MPSTTAHSLKIDLIYMYLFIVQFIYSFFSSTSETVEFAKKIAKTLKTDKANQTLLLERAENILKELLNRDFGRTNLTIIEEQEMVMTSLSRAKVLLNNTLSLWNDLSQANKTLDELLATFASIQDKTSGILGNASLAMNTNNVSRSYDSEVSSYQLTGFTVCRKRGKASRQLTLNYRLNVCRNTKFSWGL